ncbi:MAG: DNA mismatch endonuclease Vsr [Methylocystaceae bacterium]|jgi:DNA mismatch endonuclease, patch repair protein|nr:DNA mismatch endonuclease Vsr [Methylocystaceae bacterium]NBT96491.1 DNA mismatch endonuclease Vsr [Methylocystaceae bacterium]
MSGSPPDRDARRKRSAIMRAVKSKNTSAELAVRALLRQFAPGYRLHRRDVPGVPDIAYLSRKKAIFVHGCFWHGHDCPRGARIPKSNVAYWREKIDRNRNRDAALHATLSLMGWRRLVVWECELKAPAPLSRKLRRFLAKL